MEYTLNIPSGNILSLVPASNLINNTEYTVTILAGLSGVYSGEYYTLAQDYTFWFTSAYCPIYTTVGRVRLEAGPNIDILTDDTIYRMIHKNTLISIDLYNESYGLNLAYTYWGCGRLTAPYILRRFVLCKTAYDALAIVKQSQSSLSGGGGNQTKTLGDLSIKYGGSTSASASSAALDPTKLKDLYECWKLAMRQLSSGVQPAVRGYYDESKGFGHPVRELHHNRVVRPVSFTNAQPRGPWEKGAPWRGYRYD